MEIVAEFNNEKVVLIDNRRFRQGEFLNNETIETITSNLNEILEQMVKRNPDQWIWTHDRWK